MRRDLLILAAAVFLVRLPFLDLPIQGDDVYYLLIAENARVDPLHPLDFSFRLQGETVWAAGHTRPPLTGLILAGLIEAFGEVDRVGFHLSFVAFSLLAVFSMYALARRFSDRPLWAALLFLAVPAFLVNGNKLESDLPLLAFWTLGFALFVHERFLASAAALALAGFAGYQAVLAVPILAHLAWRRYRGAPRAWLAVFSAPLLAMAWQIFERATTGVAPAEVLGGYAGEYGLLLLERKLTSGLALLGHLGWMVSPLIVLFAFRGWTAAVGLAAGAAIAGLLPEPYSLFERCLYALSGGCGLTLLAAAARRGWRDRDRDVGFLAIWIGVFFAGSLALFYAGSARYLLPLAPAATLLAVEAVRSRTALALGFGLNLALGLSLAWSEARYAEQVERFVSELAPLVEGKRLWTNAEWGLRHGLGEIGGEPALTGQAIPSGAVYVESSLAAAIPYQLDGRRAELLRHSARMGPLRTIGPGSRSGYSSSDFGVLPFTVGSGEVEEIAAWVIGLPEATKSYLSLGSPGASDHLLAGFYPSDGADWRWMQPEAAALLKVPENAEAFEFNFHIPDEAPAREVTVEINGEVAAQQGYESTGGHTLRAPVELEPGSTARVVLRVDRSFSPPGDGRDLALVAIGLGFR